MKRCVFILLLLLPLQLLGQDSLLTYKAIFSEDIENYFDAINQKDWDKVSDFIYPKYFEIEGVNKLIDSFKGMEGNGIQVKIDSVKFEDYSNIICSNKLVYCYVYFSNKLNISINQANIDSFTLLKQRFVQSYGEKNVMAVEKDGRIIVNTFSRMMAIGESGSSEFKYLVVLTENVMAKLIPADVLEYLNE